MRDAEGARGKSGVERDPVTELRELVAQQQIGLDDPHVDAAAEPLLLAVDIVRLQPRGIVPSRQRAPSRDE